MEERWAVFIRARSLYLIVASIVNCCLFMLEDVFLSTILGTPGKLLDVN